MVTLNNITSNYSVNLETEKFLIAGTAIVIKESSIISSFRGNISTSNNVYCGNFSYNENDNGKVSKNIYDVDKKDLAEIEALLNRALQELINEL